MRVNAATTGNQFEPRIAPISDFQYVVVWHASDGDASGLFAQRVDLRGQRVGAEFRVNTYTTGSQRNRSVASDLAGNFVVVWRSYGQNAIMGQRFNFLAAPVGGEFRVDTGSGAANPVVAREPDGDFVVAWADDDYSSNGIFARRFLSTGAPADFVFRVNTFITGNQTYPGVGAGADFFVVTWSSPAAGEDKTGLFAQRFAASGAPLGGEFHVNTGTNGYDDSASVAISRVNGDFVIVWRGGEDGSVDSIQAQRYSSSGALAGSEFRVNTTTTGSQSTPSVALDSPTTFVVAWTSGTSGAGINEIMARRFQAAGAPIGDEFLVNSATTGIQVLPWIASAANEPGRYMVAWEAQDGDFEGIFVRAGCLVGDANIDGAVGVADVFRIINHLFAGEPAPLGCADVNASGAVDVADIFYLINFLFAAGPAPIG